MKIINLQDKNLYYIGGVVRDELLGLESFDIDLTYEGNAVEFAKTIPNAEILKINDPFGTVKIKLANQEIDIASTRSEIYPQKGHLPVVNNIGCSLKEDILRRDFTINALAKSTLTGEITDFTGGLGDIRKKQLRVLHDKSFIDDPTRIIRALKFSVRFGFELEKNTKRLQDEYLNNINYDMSYKRLKKELIETFNLNSQNAFEKFINEGIYKLVSPEEFDMQIPDFAPFVEKYKPEHIWLVYVGILTDISNLPLTKIEKKIVDDFNRLKNEHFESDFDIYKKLAETQTETAIMLLGTTPRQPILRYLDVLRHIKLDITGKDLQTLGIPSSSKYQECFDYILAEKLKNPALDKVQEIKLAKEFFKII